MNISRNTEANKAKEDHAFTLGLITWIASAALLWYLHDLSSHIKPKWISEVLDMAFFVVAFFWVFLLGSFKNYFYFKLLKK